MVEKKTKKKVSKKTTKKAVKKKPSSKKKAVKKPVKKVEKKKPSTEKYFEAVGRRKTSIARVRITTKGDKSIVVNDKKYIEYFPVKELQRKIESPLERMHSSDKFSITVKVKGGGVNSQSEAVRHGISRALVKFNPDFRKRLKRSGFLTRDPRERERKKFGLKRARRAPQWSKR